MAYNITITGSTGGTPPYSFYVCTVNGDYCQFLGTSINVPYVLSPLYQTANILYIKSIDSLGCEYFEIYNC